MHFKIQFQGAFVQFSLETKTRILKNGEISTRYLQSDGLASQIGKLRLFDCNLIDIPKAWWLCSGFLVESKGLGLKKKKAFKAHPVRKALNDLEGLLTFHNILWLPGFPRRKNLTQSTEII